MSPAKSAGLNAAGYSMNPIDPNAEWLEADGLGGFASGTVSGIRSRRYHALLLTATTPPATKLRVRPFLSGRDFHSTHHENGSFKFSAEQSGERVTFQSYDGVPAVIAYSNGRYTHDPTWYRNFLYSEELARGLDAAEDLASPGVLEFSISQKPAV